ncbi:hypothetical protein BJX64DRAFT_298058 [Aspergillus heterothallicus]
MKLIMSEEDSLLTNLCAICHIQPPKYRCPRCSTRTCSLPCTRRHKLWSQCSGIRDPAAYLRRSELASESAFDRDFNFITSIERRIERAEREAEDRGVDVSGKRVRDAAVVGLEHEDLEQGEKERQWNNRNKRKRGPDNGLTRGEAGFVRRAREGGVKVIKAPAGMSRGRVNGSKWHNKQKCLLWTVEWVTEEGTRRFNSVETCSVAEAYNRVFPLSKEERNNRGESQTAEQQEGEQSTEITQEPESDVPKTAPQSTTEPPETQPTPQDATLNTGSDTPNFHRKIYLYLHRPRTATKQPVLCPLLPNATLADSLRGRTVLEFPTIYVLRTPLTESQPEQNVKFMLEKEYLRTHPDTEELDEGTEDTDAQPVFGAVDIPDVGESKVLEVLQQDLFGAAPVAGSESL